MTDFGRYVAECLPKFVQKVQLTGTDELEVLVAPEGIVPVLSFLKDHHNAQFASLADIGGVDIPARKYRFEVSELILIMVADTLSYLSDKFKIDMTEINTVCSYNRLSIIYSP